MKKSPVKLALNPFLHGTSETRVLGIPDPSVTTYRSYIMQGEWVCASPNDQGPKAQKNLDCPEGCQMINEDLDALKEKNLQEPGILVQVPGTKMINFNVTENVQDYCWTYFCPEPRFDPGWVLVRSKYCYCNNSATAANDPYLSGFNLIMMFLNVFLSIFII